MPAANVLHASIGYAMLAFTALILIEAGWSYARSLDHYRLNNSLANLGCGLLTTTVEFHLKLVLLALYVTVSTHLAVFQIDDYSPVAWVTGVLLFDLLWYWAHRLSHETNLFWASHEPHHQSEEFNLSAALRQGVFQDTAYWPIYMVMAVAGFSAEMFVVHMMVNKAYGFVLHTRSIGKLPLLEGILATPSAHRVHHGMNDVYLDRNYGGIFMVWDRMFGSYQAEEEPVVYGVRVPCNSFDPIRLQVHWAHALWRDLTTTRNLRDRLRLPFMPTGWRPEDVRDRPRGYLASVDGHQPWRFSSSPARLALAAVLFSLLAAASFALLTWPWSPAGSGLLVMALMAGLTVMGQLLDGELPPASP